MKEPVFKNNENNVEEEKQQMELNPPYCKIVITLQHLKWCRISIGMNMTERLRTEKSTQLYLKMSCTIEVSLPNNRGQMVYSNVLLGRSVTHLV